MRTNDGKTNGVENEDIRWNGAHGAPYGGTHATLAEVRTLRLLSSRHFF
ncbi:hypothetical protein AAKU64_001645 [Undibacterium sp. GrIS 1.8]